jgi:hypothetical protein
MGVGFPRSPWGGAEGLLPSPYNMAPACKKGTGGTDTARTPHFRDVAACCSPRGTTSNPRGQAPSLSWEDWPPAPVPGRVGGQRMMLSRNTLYCFSLLPASDSFVLQVCRVYHRLFQRSELLALRYRTGGHSSSYVTAAPQELELGPFP